MTTPITRDELRTAIEHGTVIVIDALPDSYYARQHLPSAVNLVEGEVEARSARLLPDKDAAIVTYCSDTACGNSRAVATRLTKLGYTNVRMYHEGIRDWTEAGLPTHP